MPANIDNQRPGTPGHKENTMQTRMTTRLPNALADALTARAKANHRSVNGELLAILEAALSGTLNTSAQEAKP